MEKTQISRAKNVLKSTKHAVAFLNDSIPRLKECVELIQNREGDIIITGIGKSGFIGQKISATLTSLGQRASFLHPVEAFHGDLGALSEGDVLIALSFSGESKEVVKIVKYAKKHFSVPVIAFTRSGESELGKLADVVVGIHINEEGSPNGIAPMASTTSMLVVGDMLASMLVREDFDNQHFVRFHPGGNLGLKLRGISEVMRGKKELPLVHMEDTFVDVLKEVNKMKLGVTGVISDKQMLVGVITDGDIRRAFLKDKNITTLLAKDVMTKTPKYVKQTDSFEVVLKEMELHRITQMFVVDAKKTPIGIVHIHDIVESAFL